MVQLMPQNNATEVQRGKYIQNDPLKVTTPTPNTISNINLDDNPSHTTPTRLPHGNIRNLHQRNRGI